MQIAVGTVIAGKSELLIPAGMDPDNECFGATPNCNGAGMCE